MPGMRRFPALLTGASALALSLAALPASASGAAPSSPELPLGPPGLSETRGTEVLQPGVEVTTITRGARDGSTRWTVEVSVPSGQQSPDPDAPPRALQDRASAEEHVRRLADAGFGAQAEPVEQPAVADVDAGLLGYRVRLAELFPDKAAAEAEVARLRSAGFTSRAWYTGWDGTSDAPGPWTVRVVTIDPRRFRGDLDATFGPTLEDRERTTDLARQERAAVAVNGGFFVFDPRAGAEGDPAGVGVYGGHVLSEPVGDRPALLMDGGARRTAVVRPTWRGRADLPSGRQEVDGVNRVPGLIRNCGGTPDDTPTWLPLHDVTCSDPDELVAFTPAFGPTTPSGPGAEAVLDRRGVVVAVQPDRGTALGPGQRSLQGTGNLATRVASLRPGDRIGLQVALSGDRDQTSAPDVSVVNGGPELVRDGRLHITQQQDGMVHPGDPSFAYGWVLQRNPRTFAGVDARGRTLLVTVDGRQEAHLGLSIPETADVARSLGMVDAVNLDGGGSTAMAIGGQLVSSPSDAAGERAVGDAIVVR